MSKLVIESAEIVEKFVDVESEGVAGIVVTAKSTTAPDSPNGPGIMLEILNMTAASEEDENLIEQVVVFPIEQWEAIKRMGDAAIAAYREKFVASSGGEN
jgi:hypothetical protein